MSNKIDITSTAIEKGMDIAKTFIDKLIIPSVEEVGLLIKDKVTMWRFNNQVKMIIKAKEKCEDLGISPKTISLKTLCPLLEYASLEDNEILQDKWASLLANMVDSTKNIENHVFPYLLSQVSVDEFMMIEAVYKMKVERVVKKEQELNDFIMTKSEVESQLKYEIEQIDQILKEKKEKKIDVFETQKQKWDKAQELRLLEFKEKAIKNSIKKPEYIPNADLKDYEISNLLRLGIIKNIPRPYAYVNEHKIQNNPDNEYLYLQDMEITIEADEDDLILTELGELFIKACNTNK